MFSCEFREIFENIFFAEHFRVTVSVLPGDTLGWPTPSLFFQLVKHFKKQWKGHRALITLGIWFLGLLAFMHQICENVFLIS